MVIFLSLFICIVGLIIYFASKNNADVKHVGDVMFWTGLLAFLLTFPAASVHFFK